ncbi:MAG: Rrf2 family transcriptional regulator [Lachnospiraceae bacterium]|jgi:Rrf2 family protein|nr:Rrf2 family transcriptional regulator [Lachnospiraceae bacterium]MDD5956627.1 Rrf2 family transcriptional regulator [Lachnospiraceae bacterium]MDY3990326.1 Rrf2 family transcriptional regulator [Lachnospiraceae bacterium]
MKVSTRGRYAIKVMIDLAEHDNGDFIPLSDIAKRQEISEKYLEAIVSMLSKAGFLQSLRGKGGGYKLSRQSDEYTVREVLEVTEGSLAPVPDEDMTSLGNPHASAFRTAEMWKGLYDVMVKYLDSVSIKDLAGEDSGQYDFVI